MSTAAGSSTSPPANRDDIWALRIYALECQGPDPLRDPWVERGQIRTHEEGFSLDATTFEHRGRRFLCWAQKSPPTESNLYLAELADPFTLKTAPVCFSRPTLDWERIGFAVNEAPRSCNATAASSSPTRRRPPTRTTAWACSGLTKPPICWTPPAGTSRRRRCSPRPTASTAPATTASRQRLTAAPTWSSITLATTAS